MASKTAILTAEQVKFLDLISNESYLCKKFYFTGGTPLSAFYLRHRYSEDIDLFSEHEINLLPLRSFIGKVQKKLKLKRTDYRQFMGLHTFQLFFTNGEVLKVDFNYYPFPRIEKGERYHNISVDSALDIAVNKVHTIAVKPRARDFIDLYFLIGDYGYSVRELLAQAKIKFDWHIDAVQLGSRLLTASTVADYPRMIRKIDHREWKAFFVDEARKLDKEIFK